MNFGLSHVKKANLTFGNHLCQVAGNKPGDINHECPPPWRAVAFDSCQESRELSENMLPAEEEKKKNLKTVLCSTFIAKMPSSTDGTAAASTSTLMSLASARLLLKLWFLDILRDFVSVFAS